MTADEIRNCPTPAQQFRLNEVSPGFAIDAVAEFLREIAAQLAEKNAALRESIELQKKSLELQREANMAQQKVVSAFAQTPDERRILAAGIERALAKSGPFTSPAEIVAVIERVLEAK
jgi:hypothetical protein